MKYTFRIQIPFNSFRWAGLLPNSLSISKSYTWFFFINGLECCLMLWSLSKSVFEQGPLIWKAVCYQYISTAVFLYLLYRGKVDVSFLHHSLLNFFHWTRAPSQSSSISLDLFQLLINNPTIRESIVKPDTAGIRTTVLWFAIQFATITPQHLSMN